MTYPTIETPDCISPETGLSVCKHPELCVCASVNSQKSLYDANKLLEDVMKEAKKHPTFETRLVPIEDKHKIHDETYLCYRCDWHLPASCYFDKSIVDDTYEGWVTGDGDEAIYDSPTHFMQWHINGEWTHEFKMGEE